MSWYNRNKSDYRILLIQLELHQISYVSYNLFDAKRNKFDSLDTYSNVYACDELFHCSKYCDVLVDLRV